MKYHKSIQLSKDLIYGIWIGGSRNTFHNIDICSYGNTQRLRIAAAETAL